MATLDSHFERFLRERRCLKNVSPRTCEWYATAWHTFLATQAPGLASNEIATPQPLTRQHLSSGDHVLGALDEDEAAGSAFGANLGRLTEIKKKYDPKNFFRVNQNVRPDAVAAMGQV